MTNKNDGLEPFVSGVGHGLALSALIADKAESINAVLAAQSPDNCQRCPSIARQIAKVIRGEASKLNGHDLLGQVRRFIIAQETDGGWGGQAAKEYVRLKEIVAKL